MEIILRANGRTKVYDGKYQTKQKKPKKIGRKSETERIRVVEDRDEKDYKKDKREIENVESEK